MSMHYPGSAWANKVRSYPLPAKHIWTKSGVEWGGWVVEEWGGWVGKIGRGMLPILLQRLVF